MKPKQIAISKLKDHLSKYVREVNKKFPFYVVITKGKDSVAILSSYELMEKIDKKLCNKKQSKKSNSTTQDKHSK